MKKLAVLDVGGSAIKYCTMCGPGLEGKGEVPTPDGESHDPEPFLEAIEGILARIGDVEGLALSMPGEIDARRKYIRTGGALLYNYDVDVTDWEKRFRLPVEIENDARCSAIAEFSRGNLQGVNCGVVLAFGTGIGGGVVIDGKVLRGAHLFAGEASKVLTSWPERVCDPIANDRLWSSACSTKSLCERVARAKGIDGCDGRQLFSWLEGGDEVVASVFHRVCNEIALQIHNIQCWLDPERVCLGGGISQNPLFVEGVRDAHRRFNAAFDNAFPDTDIVACRFFNDANLIGAYEHFLAMEQSR